MLHELQFYATAACIQNQYLKASVYYFLFLTNYRAIHHGNQTLVKTAPVMATLSCAKLPSVKTLSVTFKG